MRAKAGDAITSVQLDTLRRQTFYGREKDDTIYPIALANLILHGIDEPHIWHGNTLSDIGVYEELFRGAPQFFDYILMNPPFGGKEGATAQTNFEYKTGATQVLFLQHVLKSLTRGGTCGIVLDEGVLFTNKTAFVQTKRKLLEECDVWCILSLAGGVFSSAGAGVKTNLVFFTKGRQTESIWYYDLSDLKVGKKTPLTQCDESSLGPLAMDGAAVEVDLNILYPLLRSRAGFLRIICRSFFWHKLRLQIAKSADQSRRLRQLQQPIRMRMAPLAPRLLFRGAGVAARKQQRLAAREPVAVAVERTAVAVAAEHPLMRRPLQPTR
ncbi:MAG: SAM-dependent methyltransferase [Gemmataceae bacterium]|nr:SAM-dependent methyltransferase [Gemmataceae bacterium]